MYNPEEIVLAVCYYVYKFYKDFAVKLSWQKIHHANYMSLQQFSFDI